MSMTIATLTAALWLTFAAQPATNPMPPLPSSDQAPAGAGECIWERMPQSMRDSIIGQSTLNGAYDALSAGAQEWGEQKLLAAGRSCGVGETQFRSAGRRMAGWAGRKWAEKQLSPRLTPQQLDRAFRAIPAADRSVLHAAFGTSGGYYRSPAREAVDRFFASLNMTVDKSPASDALMAYLVNRSGDEKDQGGGK